MATGQPCLGACGDFGIDFKFGRVIHVHRYRCCVMEDETERHDGFSTTDRLSGESAPGPRVTRPHSALSNEARQAGC